MTIRKWNSFKWFRPGSDKTSLHKRLRLELFWRQFKRLPKHAQHYFLNRPARQRKSTYRSYRPIIVKLTYLANLTKPDISKYTYIYTSFSAESDILEDEEEKKPHKAHFDSDSFLIGVDHHTSKTMTNRTEHFISPITPIHNQIVKGIGEARVVGEGTLCWHIEDDDGISHAVTIKNALYVPDLPICLLCPQQWSQQANDNYPSPRGTYHAGFDDVLELYWDQRKFKRTIPWDNRTNTCRFRSSSGAKRYMAYAAAMDYSEDVEAHEHVCFDAIPQRAARYTLPPDFLQSNTIPASEEEEKETDKSTSSSPALIIDDDDEEMINAADKYDRVDPPDEHLSGLTPEAEFMRWHQRLGHISFKKIRLLALLGILPKKILSSRAPKCASCIFAAQVKRPWRTRVPANSIPTKIYKATRPGQVVSVDQLESPTPGFIAQLKGRLTRDRYRYATIFVDHYSRLSYIHLQRTITSKDTLEAKLAFEAFSMKNGVKIQHYHADNGRFADNAFIQSVQKCSQTISYCGVNAHFQNGIAEKRIRDLQEQARKTLLHAKSRWPEAITLNLWPYALRDASEVMNIIPDNEDGSSKIERFTNVAVAPNLKYRHALFAPTFVLHSRLANNQHYPKWEPRSRLGINLGSSPNHARNVHLVLSLETGLVSPQFHVSVDDFFETTRPTTGNPKGESNWQFLSGIHKTKKFTAKSQPSPNTTFSPIDRPDPIVPQEAELDFGTFQLAPDETIEDEMGENEGVPVTPEEAPPDDGVPRSRYGRKLRRTQRMKESIEQETISFAAYYEHAMDADFKLQSDMDDPIAFLATTNKDVMYYHQAIKEPDRIQFINAMIK
eukprot:scaffold183254_cov63-Attheya_sp.AAC.2